MKILIHNIYCKIEDYPEDDIDFKLDLKKLLSYEKAEFFFGKQTKSEKTLFKMRQWLFPTGLLRLVTDFIEEWEYDYEIIDKRQVPKKKKYLKVHQYRLRDYQLKAVYNSIKEKRGILEIATGGGKTIIGLALIARLNCQTIFCVHTGDLLQQTYEKFCEGLQIPIGRVGAGFFDIQQVTICMIQSLNVALGKKYIPYDEFDKYIEQDKKLIKNKRIIDMLRDTECIIVDECQHLRAESYVNVMEATPKCYYKFGLSGTPWRNDSEDVILQAYAGKPVCQIDASYLISRGFLARPTIRIVNPLNNKYENSEEKYQTIYKNHIVENADRNMAICKYAKELYSDNRKLLILVNQIKHTKTLYDILSNLIPEDEITVLTGEVNVKTRTKLLNDMRYGDLRVIIGTTLCDEGLDIPIVDGLILGGAGKSNVRIPQRIGRTLRLHPDKQDPIIIDFYDNIRYLLGQCRERIKLYEKEKEFNVVKEFKDSRPLKKIKSRSDFSNI